MVNEISLLSIALLNTLSNVMRLELKCHVWKIMKMNERKKMNKKKDKWRKRWTKKITYHKWHHCCCW